MDSMVLLMKLHGLKMMVVGAGLNNIKIKAK